ncbi:hypothetical protein AX14_010368 [Amanita brunnescens Koide BX004]|nr:hypothetical protein AX14_010368 [Amanita brunnescens Koide BX004]
MYAPLILDPIARNAAATKSRPTGPGSETHTCPPSFPVPSHSTLNFTVYAPPSSAPHRSLIAPSAQTPTNGKIPALIEREQRNANWRANLAIPSPPALERRSHPPPLTGHPLAVISLHRLDPRRRRLLPRRPL